MSVLEELETSVNAAVKEGIIDPKKQAVVIEAARKVARVMDSDGWPIIKGGRFDNVSPSTFLKYCQSLGIVVENEQIKKKPKSSGKLAAAQSGSPIHRNGKT